ncbi:MAG: hypothetical protein EOM25_14910 [Deltaproteobacteria bacterium]|nr:hypothetical protein [Deltaproteobacteria bacterium]
MTTKTNRSVPPTVEDLYTPTHSARKLWERVGKPHGRFRSWADQAIKPLLPSSEISALSIPSKRGSPTKDYLLSTHIAEIILAQVDNDEGRELLEVMWAASRAFAPMGARNDVRGALHHPTTPTWNDPRMNTNATTDSKIDFTSMSAEDVNALVMEQTPEGAAAREQLFSAEAQALGLLYDINEGRLQESPEFIPVQTLIDVITDHTNMIATALGCDPNLMPMDMAIDILASLLGDDDAGRRELVEYLVHYDEVRALREEDFQIR